MSNILTLVKVMLKTSSQEMMDMSSFNKKKKKRRNSKATVIIVGLSFLYLGVLLYFFWDNLISSLALMNQGPAAIHVLYTVITGYMLIVGLLVVPSIFYFSKDIDRYLVMPIKPNEILIAKFITSLITMYIGSLFFILPFLISYILRVQPDFFFTIRFIFGILFVPVLPFSIALTIMILLFKFIPFFKNKDIFTYVSTIIAVLIAILFTFLGSSFGASVGSGSGMDIEMITGLQNGTNSLVNMMGSIIPSIKLFTYGVTEGKLLYLLFGIVLSIVVPIIIMTLLQNIYFSSVIGIDESSSKKKKISSQEIDKTSRQKTPLRAIMKYDIRNILRTPAFATNYFAGLIIMPIAMLIPLFTKIDNFGELLTLVNTTFIPMFNQLDLWIKISSVVGIAFIISLFLSNIGMISSTAISREGVTMLQFKAMPIPLLDVVKAKIINGGLIMAIPTTLIGILVGIFTSFNMLLVLLFIISGFIGSLCSNTIAIVLDVFSPKLVWETETQAIKQNFLAIVPLFSMIFLIVIFVFALINFNTGIVMIVSFLTILTLTALSFLALKKMCDKRLPRTLEEI